MAESQDELLVAACARVREHPHPAYVKSSELRYLAVNDAYARLFGHTAAELIGLRSDEIGEALGHGDRDDPERRCLIFGNPERARYIHPFGGGSFDIALKRERICPTLSILVGLFTPSIETLATTACAANTNADAVRPPVAAAYDDDGQERPADHVEGALDALGAGVAVFGADNRLSYANRSMREFYRTLVGELADGPVRLTTLTEALHDIEVGRTPAAERERWVAARLASYDLPVYESVARVAGGWMRLVTQRRPDGVLVALRLDVTALKESEGRLKQHSQEISLYRALLDELPVASFMRDESQRMIFANRAYVEMTGKQPEQLLGLSTLEMYPEQGQEFHEQNQFVLDTGELLESEIDYFRPDGSTLPTISRLYRVTTLDEKSYLIGSITDTTVLKKREDQLIEAQRAAEAARSDLESIVASLPVGIVVVDETGIIELVNGAFEDLWNGALPPIKGAPLGMLLRFQQAQGGTCEAGDCDEAHEQRLADIRAGEMPVREVAYANGRTVIEAGCAISGGRCLLTFIDITERREREREVLETRSALEEVGSLVKDAVTSMSQGLLIIEDDRVVLSNEALATMIAMPRELLQPGALVKDVLQSCIDRKIAGFLDEVPVDASDFGAILFTGKPASLTVFSGYQRWLRLDVTPTSRGRSVLVFSDITDLQSRQEELRQLVTRAETADKAKSEFLANMSHEIRTPMNGVLGMAELLAKSNLDTRQKTFIDIMVKSGNALLTIINDILDFSKIDAGQMTLRDVAFNPVEAIEDVATLLSAKAAEKDIELVVRGAAHMPAAVMGDAGRFRQIVTNLVGNAVKFTDRGHVLIDLACHTKAEGGVEIVIRVEDTGAGIPTEKMESIFEKFSQVDASSTRRHEGTGLGLAITDGLTRLFGGTLDAMSEIGKGSVFTARLPMTLAVAALPARILPAKMPGARILVVDAHDLSRKASHDMLLDWGFDATAVASETEALAVLAAATGMGLSVDAILLDYQPDHAPHFIRALRESPATADVSVIVLTSMNLSSEDRLLSSRDIQAHLMKPARADLLRETVFEVLRATRSVRSSVTAPEGKVLPLRTHTAPPGPAAVEGEVLDVLVAEDNEVNQILFTQMLMASGLRFRLAGNGEEAVAVYRESRPRMILMDISMPVMDGLQASRAIREIESGSGHRVPIVAVTAHVLDGDREECLAAGMDDYLAKPISIEKLEEKLDRWLKRGKVPAATGTVH
ncbi:PAS-domain containing protein [Shinella sp.]|uniref:PAS-domain containing protein n=1 Tax=Shinella sp. TaxID=1870904 RepID=UPI0029B32EBF|nr:PAS-domain containing protein [Shinella sp.]MDX3978334.1 PAS-domain containing protein [Shinella sp.]